MVQGPITVAEIHSFNGWHHMGKAHLQTSRRCLWGCGVSLHRSVSYPRTSHPLLPGHKAGLWLTSVLSTEPHVRGNEHKSAKMNPGRNKQVPNVSDKCCWCYHDLNGATLCKLTTDFYPAVLFCQYSDLRSSFWSHRQFNNFGFFRQSVKFSRCRKGALVALSRYEGRLCL